MTMQPIHTVSRALLLAVALASAALASPGAHGPNGEHLDGQAAGAATGLVRLPDGSVNVPKLAQRSMAIRTVMAKDGEHPLTVALNGRAAVDPNAGGRVQAPFAGRIEPGPQGLPVAGQTVRKGQVLAYVLPVADAIASGNQQAQLADLRANRALLEQRVRRLELLEGTVPAKDIEAARAELASLNGRERAVALSIGGRQPLLSPATGVLASASAMNGQIVEARDVLFDVVNPARMLVEAQSTDAGLAQKIASAGLDGGGDVQLELLGGGRVLRDGAVPLTFRARARGRERNPDLGLALGQPVTVLAQLKTKLKGVALPARALARDPSNQSIVWIKSGATRFIALPVRFQALDAHTVVVTAGLSADNRVVVDGAALINQVR
ncbi:efflux RND transporter periplasmic adaptor subunit [Janthinobacterium sp. CG_S6]|uniref:efflux RND transporter periplasmic adaptor subunit n=1 Tax=unclassified Janthinobacterium TaxID=2610881 RepID=UPI00036A0FDB|nr:HlyD family efflux transporter periplasmic adaptor subunit [Janthinobacterium sp. CG_S6]MEC5160858.1 cobalt-zinc-cadmium efflux system membrane fusion protein [Janthinobacterium sp. CG_S6]